MPGLYSSFVTYFYERGCNNPEQHVMLIGDAIALGCWYSKQRLMRVRLFQFHANEFHQEVIRMQPDWDEIYQGVLTRKLEMSWDEITEQEIRKQYYEDVEEEEILTQEEITEELERFCKSVAQKEMRDDHSNTS